MLPNVPVPLGNFRNERRDLVQDERRLFAQRQRAPRHELLNDSLLHLLSADEGSTEEE